MEDVRLIANIFTALGCLGLAIVWRKLMIVFGHPYLRQISTLHIVLFVALGITRGINTIYRYAPEIPSWLPWTETLAQVMLSLIICFTLAWFVILRINKGST